MLALRRRRDRAVVQRGRIAIAVVRGRSERHVEEHRLALKTVVAAAVVEARAVLQDERAREAGRTNGTRYRFKTSILLNCTATGKLVSLVRK